MVDFLTNFGDTANDGDGQKANWFNEATSNVYVNQTAAYGVLHSLKASRDNGTDLFDDVDNMILFDLATESDYTKSNVVGYFGDSDAYDGSPTAEDRFVILDVNYGDTPNFDADWTGASIDSNLTAAGSGALTEYITWDATNDEQDFGWTNASAAVGNSVWVVTNTSYGGDGGVKCGFRNMSITGTRKGDCTLSWRGISINFKGLDYSVNCLGESETSLSSVPSNIWLRITIIDDHYVRAEYSTNDSTWVKVFEGYKNTITASTTFQAVLSMEEGSTPSAISASVFDMVQWNTLHDSGYIENASAQALDFTSTIGMVRDIGSSLPTDTSITMGISSDNGTTFVDETNSYTPITITPTGTNGFLRATLAQTATADDVTPILKYAGGIWGK